MAYYSLPFNGKFPTIEASGGESGADVQLPGIIGSGKGGGKGEATFPDITAAGEGVKAHTGYGIFPSIKSSAHFGSQDYSSSKFTVIHASGKGGAVLSSKFPIIKANGVGYKIFTGVGGGKFPLITLNGSGGAVSKNCKFSCIQGNGNGYLELSGHGSVKFPGITGNGSFAEYGELNKKLPAILGSGSGYRLLTGIGYGILTGIRGRGVEHIPNTGSLSKRFPTISGSGSGVISFSTGVTSGLFPAITVINSKSSMNNSANTDSSTISGDGVIRYRRQNDNS